jgi:glycosyltransferase involved in cell wall biosynthesis
MRIVQVSAHYPPNFVSGGTLVPHRLAAALHARGHEVQVFAGHFGDDREPLDAWDEDDQGVPVHWVSITPYTAWGSDANHDNPAVTAAFAEWLRGQRPDVVHFHSLQALGASLVPVAKASGARVVVTMHDFWWLCGRQFLVDQAMSPCSLVVDCGVCSCQRDHGWLVERDRRLRDQLAAADAVLAPSASSARVLAANGISPAALRVDENGLPSLPPVALHSTADGAPAAASAEAPVRLLFTGGPDPMKGLPVLREALRHLRDVDGWTLTTYGAPAAAVGSHGDRVEVRPSYRPSDLPDVLARHDVLVLPSLMRESHSIVTREALAAGLAVVCTDTLGPEEAVEHGVNGLVVPAGDAALLAAALRRTVEEPELLAGLRATGLLAPLRRLDDQVDGLERLYTELLERPVATRGGVPIERVLFVSGIDGAPLRYRVRLAAEGLALLGVDSDVVHYRDPRLPELAAEADAVVLYRVPATRQVLDVVDAVRDRPEPVPLLFDVDDLIFDESVREEVRGIAHLPADEVELWWQGVRRYRTTMEACDAYVGSTELLCEHAAAVTGLPSHRWANGVGTLLAQASDAALARPRTPGPVRIGYFSGTTTHDHDWAAVEPAVLEVMRRHPEVELWLGGHLTPTPALEEVASRVRRLPFVTWYELADLLRDLDVNLAPLELGGRFNEAKSAIKWLEAALVAVPTVASPTQPFREVVRDGANGRLARDHDEWVQALETLVSDHPERRRLGERARRDALLELSPHLQGRRYLALLERVRDTVAASGHRAPSDWTPEVTDEPFQDAPLQPYTAPPATAESLRVTARRYAGAAVRLGRDQGPVAVASAVRRRAPSAVRALARRARASRGA